MRKLLFTALVGISLGLHAQSVKTGNKTIDAAFDLAVWTIDHNTHNGILEAGAGYGGEWTRDAAMNAWNCGSLLRPVVAETSLWSVTENKERIGHQYWDKIIWTIGAWNHYLVTGDFNFLKQAYPCIRQTMKELERDYFENYYGLFLGPAVYQDGIEAYDEPIYNPERSDQGGVLEHNSQSIKCLSTNCLYYQAYKILALMAQKFEKNMVEVYTEKAEQLKKRIREMYYVPSENRLIYLYDQHGKPHDYQEGMGIAFAALFDVLDIDEAAGVLKNAKLSPYGITAIYPTLPRNSEYKPGRHNNMIWPHVNMYYADACATVGVDGNFYLEMQNVANLAINKGKNNFYEIYTTDGIPSGGYQCGHEWDVKEHQTWCATGFIRNMLIHVFGMEFQEEGIKIEPMGLGNLGGKEITIKDLPYRGMMLDVTVRGSGKRVVNCKINGKTADPYVSAKLTGKVKVEIDL